jgi:hypothetical protein
MSNFLLNAAVRTSFLLTSRKRASQKAEGLLQEYLKLCRGLSTEDGQQCVEVPWMPGIDDDMRRWSLFMILEHNAIVNRAITATVVQLARGEAPSGAAMIDPKKDVMPSMSAGNAQIEVFADSVQQHLRVVKDLTKLRGTKTTPHPVFGAFDAHQWNCMFAFHLGLHLRQAKYVVARVSSA